MHSSRMRTTHSSSHRVGGGAGPDPRKQAPPRSRHPAQEEAPPRAPQGGTPQEQAPPREQGPPEQATPPPH